MQQRLRAWGIGSPELLLLLREAADKIDRLEDVLERAENVARNSCEGWNDALIHEGASIAADEIKALFEKEQLRYNN